MSEDTLGFGVAELKTVRDLVIKPKVVLEAWMTEGPTGGGQYARPLRLYLALNALLMLILFLRGGLQLMLAQLPSELLNDLVQRSGKSYDAFIADADGWMTLVLVPILAAIYAFTAAPLFRWWDVEDLGWRRGFRAAFAWLCAWTVLMIPFSWWSYETGAIQPWIGGLILFMGLVAFMRMGSDRWYRSPFTGVLKGAALAIAMQIVSTIGFVPVFLIGIAAGLWAP